MGKEPSFVLFSRLNWWPDRRLRNEHPPDEAGLISHFPALSLSQCPRNGAMWSSSYLFGHWKIHVVRGRGHRARGSSVLY